MSYYRFLSKVKRSETGCLLWTAHRNRGGYGVYRTDNNNNNKTELAHRVSHRLFVGVIPEGLKVLHKCDTPACVHPEHLFLGTQKDNMHDMKKKGRDYHLKITHCPKGHSYTGTNLRIQGGKRLCIMCRRKQDREKYRIKNNVDESKFRLKEL